MEGLKLNLVVSDMEASIAFYERIGLEIPDTAPEFERHHRSGANLGGIGLDLDSSEFARHWDGGWRGGMGVLVVDLESRERVDELYAELTGAGYPSQQEPYDAFWGARFAVVEDPDGNAVGLMSPMSEEMRSAPGFPPA